MSKVHWVSEVNYMMLCK